MKKSNAVKRCISFSPDVFEEISRYPLTGKVSSQVNFNLQWYYSWLEWIGLEEASGFFNIEDIKLLCRLTERVEFKKIRGFVQLRDILKSLFSNLDTTDNSQKIGTQRKIGQMSPYQAIWLWHKLAEFHNSKNTIDEERLAAIFRCHGL